MNPLRIIVPSRESPKGTWRSILCACVMAGLFVVFFGAPGSRAAAITDETGADPVVEVPVLQGVTVRKPLRAWLKELQTRPDPSAFNRVALFVEREEGVQTLVAATLAEFLQNQPREIRLRAISALSYMGERAYPAISAIVAALRDDDDQLRVEAVYALVGLGRYHGQTAVPDLRKGLHDSKAIVRVYHAWALWFITRNPDELLPILIADVGNAQNSEFVRQRAALALSQLGLKGWPAAPALKDMLKDPSGMLRLVAAKALWQLDCQPQSILSSLIDALNSPSKDIRQAAAELFTEMEEAARPAIPSLRSALARESDTKLANTLSSSLDRIDGVSDPILEDKFAKSTKRLSEWLEELDANPLAPAVLHGFGSFSHELPSAAASRIARHLTSPSRDVRLQMIQVLRCMGRRAYPGLPLLVHALEDTDENIADAAYESIRNLKRHVLGDSIADLRSGLRHATASARVNYARTLFWAEGQAAEVRPVLMAELANQGNPESVRVKAAEALPDEVQNHRSRAALRQAMLTDSSELVRIRAAKALWWMEFRPESVLPTLVDGLKSRSAKARSSAASVLCTQMGDAGRPAVEALKEAMLHENDADCKVSLVSHIDRLGYDAVAQLAPILAKLAAENPDSQNGICSYCLRPLEKLWPKPIELIPIVQPILKRRLSPGLYSAAHFMECMGAQANAALSDLTEIAKDSGEPWLSRKAALDAIKRIDPNAAKSISIN